LLREPLDHIMAVARLLGEWLEVAAGISAAANIDKRKRVTMRREVGGSRVIRVRDVRRQRENYWGARGRSIFCFWQIQGCVQFDFVPHRNLYAPVQIVIGSGA